MIHRKLLLCLAAISWTLLACDGAVPTRDEIVAKYPDADPGTSQPENTRVLCPFLRMLQRAGLFEGATSWRTAAVVPVRSVAKAAREFGCASLECGAVSWVISGRQGTAGLDLEGLHAARGISHECGLTFGKGETELNPSVRQATLDRLAELADADGNLVYEDIQRVKLEICAAQNVKMTTGGEIEMKAMFAYLGGVENGSVRLSDVEKLLNATMPDTKTTSWVNSALIGQVQ